MATSDAAEPAALLEREHEVERVRAALQAVGRRVGAVLVIEGTAGIGNSRLLEEARECASELGIRILNARATELEQRFPYGVVRQLVERPLLEADAGERALSLLVTSPTPATTGRINRYEQPRGGAGCRARP